MSNRLELPRMLVVCTWALVVSHSVALVCWVVLSAILVCWVVLSAILITEKKGLDS